MDSSIQIVGYLNFLFFATSFAAPKNREKKTVRMYTIMVTLNQPENGTRLRDVENLLK